jgi:hypothetical protein
MTNAGTVTKKYQVRNAASLAHVVKNKKLRWGADQIGTTVPIFLGKYYYGSIIRRRLN